MTEILRMAVTFAYAGAMTAVFLLACAATLMLVYMAYKTFNNLHKKLRMYRRLRRAEKRHRERESEKLRVIFNGRVSFWKTRPTNEERAAAPWRDDP